LDQEEKIKEQMMQMLQEKMRQVFTERVIDYGMNPKNCSVMDRPDGYAKFTGPCGDTVEIFLRVNNGKIQDISYTTDGCMTSHAAVSAATVMARGRLLKECLAINQDSILEHLGGLPEDSRHCALLAAKTFHKALRHYLVK
jgi:nitrogen fixation protein NifU and related proteins